MSGHDIIVIGASAGGIGPLRELASSLPPDLPATLLAVLHSSQSPRIHLPAVIANGGALPVRFAAEGEAMPRGVLLLAPPDQHLIVKENEIRLTRGPHENFWRPSVDVLFRSAAIAYGPRVIGVVLSGALDDGTAGLAAIKACGGIAIVQDPKDAQFDDMPASALRNVEVDAIVRVAELPEVLQRFIRTPAGPARAIPEHLKIEARFAEEAMPSLEEYAKVGKLSENTCPECGGPLREAPGEMLRYRCLTGHAFSGDALAGQTRHDIESSLWSAIRLLQQRANIERSLAQKQSERGRLQGADQYATRAAEAEGHAAVLRELLMKLPE
jgi:two-component system chemotaxis response regulator CheB